MAFSLSAINQAWERTGGKFENCGKILIRDNHSEDGGSVREGDPNE